MIDEDKFRMERIEEQMNDITELNQHEVTNLKQVRSITYSKSCICFYREFFFLCVPIDIFFRKTNKMKSS